MTEIKPSLNKRSEYYILLPMLFFYIALTYLYPFVFLEIGKYLLFQVCFVILPAYFFSTLLLEKDLTKMQKIMLGYPVSVVAIYLLSWIGKLLGTDYLPALLIPVSLISLYKIIKDKNNPLKEECQKALWFNVIIYFICAGITFLCFTKPATPPTELVSGYYYDDTVWTIGNTWTYLRGFPLIDSRMEGLRFAYHMIQNIIQANVSTFTGIDPFRIHYYMEPIFDWFFFSYILVNAPIVFGKFSFRKSVIFTLIFLFMRHYMYNYFSGHIFVNLLSLYFGMPAFLIFIFTILAYLSNREKQNPIYIAIVFMFVAGTKSSMLALLPLPLLFILIIKFLRKEPVKQEVILGILIVLGGSIVRFTVLKDMPKDLIPVDEINSKALAYILLNKIPLLNHYKDGLYLMWTNVHRALTFIIGMLIYPPMTIMCMICIFNKVARKSILKITNGYLLIYAGLFAFFNMVMFAKLHMPYAVPYFYWYTAIIILMPAVMFMDYLIENKNKKLLILAVLILLPGFIRFANFEIRMCIYHLSPAYLTEMKLKQNKLNIITKAEWEAIEWLKANSDIRQIIFSDRRWVAHPSGNLLDNFFLYSSLSGRHSFIAGSAYIRGANKLISDERWRNVEAFIKAQTDEEKENILKNIHADFFIQSLRFNTNDYSRVKTFNLVFENKDIKIYKIQH